MSPATSKNSRLNITRTREITNPTYYVEAISGEYSKYAFDEERAAALRGRWREEAFGAPAGTPLDLEIGTGSGIFFAHRAVNHPDRLLLGIELKFKPLIQAIRRALNQNAVNARIMRYHAAFLEDLFIPQEVHHVFIHHPDPWEKRRKQKHRLMKRGFLERLHRLQHAHSFLDFKTDSHDYFLWAVNELKHTPYKIERYTEDLHGSPWAGENVITQFERIFISKGQPIYYLRALT